MKIRSTLAATLLLGLTTSLGPAISKEPFPDKPVEYIVPFAKDGESDISARIMRPFFKETFGYDLVILNRAGGGGTTEWSRLNLLEGDGYTIMGVNLPHIIFRPAHRKLGFKTKQLTPVYFNHFTPDAIMVRADSPFKTLEDLLEYARKNPGKLKFSGSGMGSSNHMAQLKFDQLTGLNTSYDTYRGTYAALTALVRKKVMAEWGFTTIADQLRGKVRLLAVATEERHPIFPDVPTFSELGIDLVGGAYRGIAVPDSTSEELRNHWSDIMARLNANPDFHRQMTDRGFAMTDISYSEMNLFMQQKGKEYLSAARRAKLIQ